MNDIASVDPHRIRQALERQAERAPSAERVIAALPLRAAQQSRRVRRRMVGAGLAAGVVAAAVAVVPLVGIGRSAGPNKTSKGLDSQVAAGRTVPVGGSTLAPGGVPGAVTIPVRYSPTWLPVGLFEQLRTTTQTLPTSAPGQLTRTFGRADSLNLNWDVSPRLNFSVGTAPLDESPGAAMLIDGRSARYSSDGETGTLTWQETPALTITLQQTDLDLNEATMVRIARSVRADPSRFTMPIRVGSLPHGVKAEYVTGTAVGPTSWAYQAVFVGQIGQVARVVEVSLGTRVEVTVPGGGQALTVGGQPARYLSIRGTGTGSASYLVETLSGGRTLTVATEAHNISGSGSAPPLSKAEVVAIASSVQIGTPDLGWATR